MATQALVACTEMLLLVDLDTHHVEVVEDHRGEYYGITWPRDGRTLCLSHSGVDNATLIGIEDYVNSERGWVSLGERDSDHFLSAPHQILCVDDLIVGTNTGRNCLSLVRLEDFFYRQHWLDDIRWDRTSAQSQRGAHLNSVYFRNDRLYVVAHNHDRPSTVCVLAWPSLALLETWDTGAKGAHNVWPHGETFLVCDSLRGRIVDARSQAVLWETTAKCGILRGVAQYGNRLWVGGSAFAARGGRKTADSAIYLVDPATWQLRDTLELPACGAVHEIRLLHVPDACHHGHPLLTPVAGDLTATARYHERVKTVREHLAKIRGWTIQDGDVVAARDEEVTLIDGTFAIATADAPPTQDVQIHARVTIPPSEASHHFALVARYRGPGDQNMVAAIMYRNEGMFCVELWRQSEGAWVKLAATRLTAEPTELPMTFIVSGPELTVHIQDTPILQVQDQGAVWKGVTGVRGFTGHIHAWESKPFAHRLSAS